MFADDDAGPRGAFLVAGREEGRIISRRRLCLLVAAEVLAFAQRLVSGCDRNGMYDLLLIHHFGLCCGTCSSAGCDG
jgi:hypothetical protein